MRGLLEEIYQRILMVFLVLITFSSSGLELQEAKEVFHENQKKDVIGSWSVGPHGLGSVPSLSAG